MWEGIHGPRTEEEVRAAELAVEEETVVVAVLGVAGPSTTPLPAILEVVALLEQQFGTFFRARLDGVVAVVDAEAWVRAALREGRARAAASTVKAP